MRTDQDTGPADIPRVPHSRWETTSLCEERLEPTPRETIWFRVLGWMMMMLGLGYLLVVVSGSASQDEVLFGTLKGLSLMALSQFALMSLCRHLEDTVYPDGKVAELADRVPAESAVAMRVTLLQAGVVTGADHGWSWVDGGAVHFLGHGSEFRITRELVPPLGMWPGGEQPKHDILYGSVALHVPAEPFDLRVRMQALQPFQTEETRQNALKFSKALRHWLAHHTPAESEALMPPLGLHPALTSSRLFPHEAKVLGVVMAFANLGVVASSTLWLAAGSQHALSHGMALLTSTSMLVLAGRFLLATQRVRSVRQAVQNLADGVNSKAARP